MMPTWWVSCAALVLVAVFVPLLAVAVALPYVDDVHLWVDWYPPCLRTVPYYLLGSYVSLYTLFTLCAILCRLTRRPVSTHGMSCVDLSTCFVDLCVVLTPQTSRLLHSLGSTLALLCRLVHSCVGLCTLVSAHALLC